VGTYIRIKHRTNTSGNEYDYAYLVQWTSNPIYAHQKHLRYLGKVHTLPQIHPHIPHIINHALSPKELLTDLLRVELLKHGFRYYTNYVYTYPPYFVDLHHGTVYTTPHKEVVLQLNAGYLCTYTLQNLFNPEHPLPLTNSKAFVNFLALNGIDLNQDELIDLHHALTNYSLVKGRSIIRIQSFLLP